VEQELNKKWPQAKTMLIQADFSDNSKIDFYSDICQKVKDLDLSVVVLNAGLL
jgi:hypothetical protein